MLDDVDCRLVAAARDNARGSDKNLGDVDVTPDYGETDIFEICEPERPYRELEIAKVGLSVAEGKDAPHRLQNSLCESAMRWKGVLLRPLTLNRHVMAAILVLELSPLGVFVNDFLDLLLSTDGRIIRRYHDEWSSP